MEQIIFKDYAELGNSMYEIASGDGESITAVLPCDDAVFIMRWLLEYEDIDVGNIQISEDYDDEYYVTIDEFLFLNIKPATFQVLLHYIILIVSNTKFVIKKTMIYVASVAKIVQIVTTKKPLKF